MEWPGREERPFRVTKGPVPGRLFWALPGAPARQLPPGNGQLQSGHKRPFSLRVCSKFNQWPPSGKFCFRLRWIFRRIARIRLQNPPRLKQNFLAFGSSLKFEQTLKESVGQKTRTTGPFPAVEGKERALAVSCQEPTTCKSHGTGIPGERPFFL